MLKKKLEARATNTAGGNVLGLALRQKKYPRIGASPDESS